MNIEERCQCGFSTVNILEPRFYCFSNDAVTYQAGVIGTGTASPNDIVTYVQEWITQGPVVTFDVLIEVDSSCQVIVTSLANSECSNPNSASLTSIQVQLTLLVGVSSGVVALVLAVIIVNNIICCGILRRRTKLAKLK